MVEFLDPITRYSDVKGYLFNIGMLRNVFSPIKFELHDLRLTAPHDVTTRWTMSMSFAPAKWLNLSKWWDPCLIFTGTSTYGFNQGSGKINRHIDTWDSVDNQEFFSVEAFADFWKQLLQFYRTPQLESPQYTVLKWVSIIPVGQS